VAISPSSALSVPGYRVLKHLGNGARSTIWQARNNETGDLIALKRVLKQGSQDQRFLDQASNEFTVAGHLDHPVVRKVFRLRRIRKFIRVCELHLYMELCEGRTVQERRPTEMADVMHIFTQVAEGVAHMNRSGFVHADLKPNNILVDDDRTVKLIDLGQSCPVGTTKQRIQGTPDYIAPEQVGRKPLDARTDVFNFGATLYWVLVGKPISTALPKNGEVTLRSDTAIAPPDQKNEKVPPALSKLVMDCIELLPSRRPSNMDEVISRLELVNRAMQKKARAN